MHDNDIVWAFLSMSAHSSSLFEYSFSMVEKIKNMQQRRRTDNKEHYHIIITKLSTEMKTFLSRYFSFPRYYLSYLPT